MTNNSRINQSHSTIFVKPAGIEVIKSFIELHGGEYNETATISSGSVVAELWFDDKKDHVMLVSELCSRGYLIKVQSQPSFYSEY